MAVPSEPQSGTWDRWVEVAIRERAIPLLYDVAALSVRLEQSLLDVVACLDAESIP